MKLLNFLFLSFFFFLFVILVTREDSFAQQSKIDSLLTLLRKDKEDTSKVNHLNNLCWEYHSYAIYDSAMQYANAALQLAEQLNFKRGLASSYNELGVICKDQGNYDKALENHFASLKIKKEIGDKKGIAFSYNNIGIVYRNQGNYDKALENYFASLKIKEEIGDKQSIAGSYNNIGIIYQNQRNYTKALENYFKALSLNQESGNRSWIAANYTNIGNVYTEQKNYQKALKNHFASLEIRKEIDDKSGIASSYSSIGIIYSEQGNYNIALENFFASLEINEKIGDKKRIAMSYHNIGFAYREKNNYTQALVYLQKSLKLSKEIGAKDLLMEAYMEISETYSRMNNYKNAYGYHRLYSQIKDSIFSAESNKQIAEMSAKYETEKKERENTLLAQKNRMQHMEIKQEKEKRNMQLIILTSSLAFTVLAFILLYYRYKFKQKAMMEKESNLQQKFRFKAVMDAEEKERRRIAQELHDGLGQTLSTLKLNVSSVENLIDVSHKSPFKNSLSLIDDACDEVRTISHNMMPSVLIRLGFFPALRELARRINDSKQLAVTLEMDFEDRFDESTEVAVYRIVQEVLNNMIKHSQAKNITIKLYKSDNDFFMQITDDGTGFDTALINRSEGIGWKNIYSRTAMMNGTLDVASAPAAGTTIRFYFPLVFSDK